MRYLIILITFSTLVACGGRSAVPETATRYGDNKMTCDQIEFEGAEIQNNVSSLIGEKDNKRGKNIGWGIAGLVFFPLWLGLDLSDAQQVELRALEARNNVLRRLAHKKDCDFVM